MITDEHDPLVGQTLKDAYRITGLIGEGGFAHVYRAIQLNVERPVAVKVLRADRLGGADPELHARLVARIEREAIATSRLEHPNTVRLFDFGEAEGGRFFLVLELLDGVVLSALLREEGALAPARAASIARQVCKSLAEAHDKGIVHRDLKPANVMLCEYAGEADFAKVMDFGVARFAHEQRQRITKTGSTQGTPAYMSPEQVMGEDAGPQSDFYSVGIMLFEMLTGRRPFQARSQVELGMLHLSSRPPVLELPGEREEAVRLWRRLVGDLLAKKPDHRPGTAAEIADRLMRIRSLCRSPAQRIAGGVAVSADTMETASGLDADALAPTESVAGPLPLRGAPSGTRHATETGTTSVMRRAIRPPRRRRLAAAGVLALGVVGAGVWLGRAPTEALTADARALHHPCARAATVDAAACADGELAWCDSEGARVRCCPTGLVPPLDGGGACECPPGGVGEASPLRSRCEASRPVIAAAELAGALRGLQGRLPACWPPEARDHRAPVGFRLDLTPDGRVFSVTLDGADDAADVRECIEAAARRTRFPPPQDGLGTVQRKLSVGSPVSGTP